MPNIGPVELLVLSLWIVLLVVVGVMASKRRRNVAGWVLLGFFTSPFVPIIVLAVLGEATPVPIVGAADEIAKLAALRDSGAITPEEYEGQKQALLAAGRRQR